VTSSLETRWKSELARSGVEKLYDAKIEIPEVIEKVFVAHAQHSAYQ
jgi:hypothetical protein